MISVYDNFMPNAEQLRIDGLNADYIDWEAPDGEVYKRICITEIPGLHERLNKAMGYEVEMLGMGYRLNFNDELPNAAIHSDLGWGKYALVLYLSDGIGGTAFWEHEETKTHRIDPGDFELFEKVRHDWNEESRWRMRDLKKIKFNRGLIYESALFHSRYPFKAFGTGPDDGRLIVVAFFN